MNAEAFAEKVKTERGRFLPLAWGNPFQRLALFTFLVVFAFVCLLNYPIDDGLRHVGLAYDGSRSWAEVYPYSKLEDHADFSLWFGYDLSLHLMLRALAALGLPPLIAKVLLLKLLMFLLGLGSFILIVHKSGVMREVVDYSSLCFFAALVFVSLSLYIHRSMMARPFVFGTFFLAYSIGAKGVVRGAGAAGLLSFFYPHLAWFYILPAGVGHFIAGSRRFAVGALLFLSLFLAFQPADFWGLQKALFASDPVRRQMGAAVTEFAPSLSHFSVVFYLVLVVALFPFFRRKAQSLSYPVLLILAYLTPALLYVRTFLDVLLPLLFIAFGRELFILLGQGTKVVAARWQALLAERLPASILDRFTRLKITSPTRVGSISFRVALFGGFFCLVFICYTVNAGYLEELRSTQAALSSLPEGETALTSFNQQYRTLFLRPDLRLIPSPEIGFPCAAIQAAYVDFFKAGRFLKLAEQTGARFLIEAQDIYLDPAESRTLRLRGSAEKFHVWEITRD
jgi:hypothetical protein